MTTDSAKAGRVAFTLRFDSALLADLDRERTALSTELGVSVSRTEFFERMARARHGAAPAAALANAAAAATAARRRA